jgi:uncharacterized protein RhaS with RHS repeats
MTVHTGSVPRTYYTIRDIQNTVLALVATNGAVVESYDYDAWGRVLSVKNGVGQALAQSAVGNRYLWQGRDNCRQLLVGSLVKEDAPKSGLL